MLPAKTTTFMMFSGDRSGKSQEAIRFYSINHAISRRLNLLPDHLERTLS